MNRYCSRVIPSLAFARKSSGFSICGLGHSAFPLVVRMSGTRRGADQMAYISKIAAERALRSLEEGRPDAVRFHHATEAAHVLLATSRRHARRFALAMHSRVARGLDVALIEHWARVVTEVTRLIPSRP
jgi:hypothetical protein